MSIHTYQTPDGCWEAIDDNFDGAPENRDELIGGVKGRGETQTAAIESLREQMEEET